MKANPRKNVDEETQTKIVKLYRDDNLTQRQVADRCKCSTTTVVSVLRAHGVTIDRNPRF